MSRRAVIGVVVLVVAVIAATLTATLSTVERQPTAGAVALIELTGQVVDVPQGFVGGGITPRLVRQRLADAQADPRVGAVILRLNSPGGTVAASQEIWRLVAEHPQPVVVSIGDQSVSGGYYIAAGADAIVAHPGSYTGSIGVILSLLDYSELLEDLGVEFDVVTSGEHKDMFMPGRLTAERRAMLQVQSDQFHEQFIAAVAEGRGMDVADVRRLATGEMYTGEQALALGLVDELGGLPEALRIAGELAGIDHPRLVERQPGFLEMLSTPGSIRMGLLDLLTTDRATSRLDVEQQLSRLIHGAPEARYQP